MPMTRTTSESSRGRGGSPRRPRIGRMNEVKIDRQTVEGSEACFAVAEDRLRATIGEPAAAGPRHAALRHDSRPPLHAAAAKSAGQQSLVVSELSWAAPVGARGVEDGHTRLRGGSDRGESEL